MDLSFHIAASDSLEALCGNDVEHLVTVPDRWQRSVHRRVAQWCRERAASA